MLKYKFLSINKLYSFPFQSSSVPLWELKTHITLTHSISTDSSLLFFDNSNVLLTENSSLYKNSLVLIKRVPNFIADTKTEKKTIKPPNDYICFRCGDQGHFIQDCPTNNDPNFDYSRITKPSGIPKDFLEITTQTEEGVMVGLDGVCVTSAPRTQDWNFDNKKIKTEKAKKFFCKMCTKIMRLPVKTECGCFYCYSCKIENCCDESGGKVEFCFELCDEINKYIQSD